MFLVVPPDEVHDDIIKDILKDITDNFDSWFVMFTGTKRIQEIMLTINGYESVAMNIRGYDCGRAGWFLDQPMSSRIFHWMYQYDENPNEDGRFVVMLPNSSVNKINRLIDMYLL